MPTTVVIKYSGHAMEDPALRVSFARSLTRLAEQDMHLVVVHGGGPHISRMLGRLQIETRFEKGLRVTDAPAMEAVEMVLCGHVNKDVVSSIQQAGGHAVGICGKDADLFQAHILRPELGLVGHIHTVNAGIVRCLLEGGYIPVIAPVAVGAEGMSLNVNADTAAGALAGVLQAAYFVLIADVPGVLDAEGKLIPHLDRQAIATLQASEVIHGGMIPKVDACLHALDAGCQRALILDGRAEASLERYLLQGAAFGTLITS